MNISFVLFIYNSIYFSFFCTENKTSRFPASPIRVDSYWLRICTQILGSHISKSWIDWSLIASVFGIPVFLRSSGPTSNCGLNKRIHLPEVSKNFKAVGNTSRIEIKETSIVITPNRSSLSHFRISKFSKETIRESARSRS